MQNRPVTSGPYETPQERAAKYRRSLEARSPATPPDRLRELSTDPVRPVRLYVARNPNSPSDALEALAADKDVHVRWCVLFNPNAPEAALRRLAEAEAEEERERKEVRERNGARESFIVRSRVLLHSNAGRHLRRELKRAGARKPRW